MNETVSSTYAARNFGELLARVKHRGDSFILTRNDRPVAELRAAPGSQRGTMKALRKALTNLPEDPTFADDLESANKMDDYAQNAWDS